MASPDARRHVQSSVLWLSLDRGCDSRGRDWDGDDNDAVVGVDESAGVRNYSSSGDNGDQGDDQLK